MIALPITDPETYLPHSGRMVLLDSIDFYDESSLKASATIGSGHILLPDDADALPVHLGMEIMAQGIAAWAGIQAALRGEPVRLGFLLGSRKIRFDAQNIPVGSRLTISVQQSYQDAVGMGVFESTLTHADGSPIISGALTVFSPNSQAELDKMLVGT